MLTNNLFTPPFSIYYCNKYERLELEHNNVPDIIKKKAKHNNKILYVFIHHAEFAAYVWTIEKDVVIPHGLVSKQLINFLSLPDLFDRLYDHHKYRLTSIINDNFVATFDQVYGRKNIPALKY